MRTSLQRSWNWLYPSPGQCGSAKLSFPKNIIAQPPQSNKTWQPLSATEKLMTRIGPRYSWRYRKSSLEALSSRLQETTWCEVVRTPMVLACMQTNLSLSETLTWSIPRSARLSHRSLLSAALTRSPTSKVLLIMTQTHSLIATWMRMQWRCIVSSLWEGSSIKRVSWEWSRLKSLWMRCLLMQRSAMMRGGEALSVQTKYRK